MSTILSQALMTLATRCLGQQRRDWARAMQAEFAAAVQDGKAAAFSTGCLIAAWRQVPADAEGRLLLARYALALGLILPVAALLLSGALFRAADIRHIGILACCLGRDAQFHLVNDGNRAAAPVLTQLIAAFAAMRLAAAWATLDCNWTRVAVLERLSAAAAITLAVLAGIATLDATRAILPMTALTAEVIAVAALARRHDPTPGCDA